MELHFLQKKRHLNYFSSFNKISEQKNDSFIIPKTYEFYKNNKNNNYFKSLINHEQIKDMQNKFKKINLNKIKNAKKNKANTKNNELINKASNFKENDTSLVNINENEKKYQLNLIESNNLNNLSNTKVDKKEIKNSKKIFNVTLMNWENEDENENIFKNYNSNNNEVKVLKNNKVVYVNSSLLNSYYTYKNLKIVDKISFVGRSKRSSKYRGVSKNGNQWQVLIMLDKNKSYIRSYSSEYIAARVYDILAIKSKGIKARTNFIYDSFQIKNIIDMNIDIKAKNINEIILSLFG